MGEKKWRRGERETLRVGSKKMKSEHDRNRHARSRSKQPRNTIFLQRRGRAREWAVKKKRASRRGGKAPTIGSATSRRPDRGSLPPSTRCPLLLHGPLSRSAPPLQKNRVSRLFGARSSVTVAVVLTFHFLRTDSQRFSLPPPPLFFSHHGSRFYKFEIRSNVTMKCI